MKEQDNKNFIEFDTRKKAKMLAEFITPPILRKFIANKIKGENLNILDVSIGSGQLLFDLSNRLSSIIGYDVNNESLQACKQNFKNKVVLYNQDFITSNLKETQDICVCNYPFSLRATKEQESYVLQDDFLSQFYDKKVTGLLDFVFILKSFNYVKDGYYLCFPGIAYRKQEEKFRKYLIDNEFIKEYGLIENCQFEHTSISILYIHLSKEKTKNPKSFLLDFKTNELIEDNAMFDDYRFLCPSKKIERKTINPVEVEALARKQIEDNILKQYQMSLAVYELDKALIELPHPKIWINKMMKGLLKIESKKAIEQYEQGRLF